MEKETKGHGEFWARLPVLVRKSIAGAHQEIRLKGLTLAQVWCDHRRWAKDLQQAAREVKAYEDAVTEWKQRKRAVGKDERYINEASALLLKFGQGRLRQNIHEIRPNLRNGLTDTSRGVSRARRPTPRLSRAFGMWR